MKRSVPFPWLVVTGKTDGVVLGADGSDFGRNIETDHIDNFNQANAHRTRQN